MRERILKLASRPAAWLAVTAAVFAGLLFSNGVPFVYADGYCYYHIARSLTDHGSFTSPVEPEYFDYKGHVITEFNGRYATVCSPGTSLFLLPGIAIGQILAGDSDVYTDYFMAFNGHPLTDGIMILLTAAVTGFATLVLLYKAMRELGYTEKISAAATAIVYSSSFAIWYVMLLPTYTHTYELFAVSLGLYALARYLARPRMRFAALMGLAGSIAFIVRPTSVIPAVIQGLYLLSKRRFRDACAMIASTVPALIVWMLYNLESYGSPVASGYSTIRGETFSLGAFHFFDVLASPHHGWLVFSPVMLFALAGLVLLLRRKRIIAVLGLATVFGTALIFGFWPSWAGGASFGSRFMIVAAAFCVPGMAEVLVRISSLRLRSRRTALALLIFLLSWTLVLTGMYRFTPVGRLTTSGYYTAFDMYRFHFDLLRSSEFPLGWVRAVYGNASGGNSLLGLLAGAGDYVYRLDTRDVNDIHFKVLKPQQLSHEPETAIEVFVLSGGTVYRGAMPGSAENVGFSCKADGCTGSELLTLTAVTDHPPTLSEREYEGLLVPGTDIRLLIRRQHSSVFKGREIYLPPGVYHYDLQ
ncbi:MAG: hypothetical protein TR69_WS6001001090 [candidate division WS6 bacterium OLB20]|uniref:Glycosyltransferase RgtA/B/C/D-like domain-containing protein n=1 Tax=candidate division WS6 bacterium OLB20 TaxID=1617426 RepID=A0A136LZI3_9BACT|nr:MAG: hypothetical protein TR69_WS6001001090 [candidate division WS6 bacterium OLB20]